MKKTLIEEQRRFFQIMSIIDESFKTGLSKNKARFLNESDEDIDWDLYEKLDEVKNNILHGFLEDRERGVTSQPWEVVPFARLKKIWEDFMNSGVVRDTGGLHMIEDIIQTNIIKLYVNTELTGHSTVNPDEDFDEYNFTEEDKNAFYDYIEKISDYAFSDFGGRRLGLLTLLSQLRKARTPEEKVPIIDQILNVVHWTSDLASYFVEGGSRSLSQLSGSPSEALNEGMKSDYKNAKDALMRSKSIGKEMKEKILKYLTSGSTYKEGGHAHGLSKPKELMDKTPKADGVSMGADKDGYFVYTHRQRSKSYESPEKIPVKEIVFTNSTG